MDRPERGHRAQTWAGYLKQQGVVASGATQLSFTQSEADVFGDKPKAAMLYEGDFVATDINKLGKFKVGDTAKFFNFPSINGSPPAVVSGGDEAVALKNTPAAMALMAYLASPEAATIWAAKGGFLSANTKVDPSVLPGRRPPGRWPPRWSAPSRWCSTCPTRPRPRSAARRAPTSGCILTKFVGDPSNPAATADGARGCGEKDYARS